MSQETKCFYCEKDQRLHDQMIEIGKLDVSTVYLFKEQTYRGRCIVAFNRHVKEVFELSQKEVEAFFLDVTRAADAVSQAFSPDKINYGIFGDTNPHLHCHVVPKYEGGHRWGTIFEMMPSEKKFLTEGEYQEIINSIKKFL